MIIFKRFSLSMLVLVTISVFAGPVSRDAALQKARKFMPTKQFSEAKPMTRSMAVKGQNAYYIFNADNGGFVIVSGDDQTEEILGYSDKGEFTTEDMPENLRTWLDSYADQIAYLQDHPKAQTASKTLDEPAIEPLLGDIEWNQISPFNDLCPLGGKLHCPTGCTATAMAQIMYYYRWPNQIEKEIPGYVTQTQKYELSAIPAGTTIDWDHILPKYKDNGESDEQKQAVSKFMLMCGTAVQMDYRSGGSSGTTEKALIAYNEYFDYDASISYVSRHNYKEKDWNQLIYNEIAAGRPVHYVGYPVKGDGHAFIIDGFSKDDFFHINWGWGGNNNGYFSLAVLNPYNEQQTSPTETDKGLEPSYKLYQEAIIGIKKNEGTEIKYISQEVRSIQVSYTELSRNTSGNFYLPLTFSVRYDNKMGIDYDFEIAAGLFDKKGNRISEISSIKESHINDGEKKSLSYSYSFKLSTDIPDGEFLIKPISRIKGTDEWKVIDQSDLYYIRVVINGDNLTAEVIKPADIVVDLDVSIVASGKVAAGNIVPVTVKITNKGDDYRKNVYFFVDEELQAGCLLDLDTGQTKELVFSFIPSDLDEKTLSLRNIKFRESNEYPIIYSTTVKVERPDDYFLKIALEAENMQDGFVVADALKLKATITNIGLGAYEGDVKFNIYNTANVTCPISISGKQTKEIDFEFGYLENGTYIIRSYYIRDGEEVSGGESYRVEFQNKSNKSPYAVYNDGTLTFCFDDKKSSKQGTVYEIKSSGRCTWGEKSKSIEKVVLDESFKDYYPQSTAEWFSGCSILTEIIGIGNLNTSKVTSMQSMFKDCKMLTALDVTNFYTSNVTNMSYMFSSCSSITTLDVSHFETSGVTDMENMFSNCSSLTGIDVSKFSTNKVTNMFSMFYGCKSLERLDLSQFVTSAVTDMGNMFNGCSSLSSIDVSHFNTAEVTNMNSMFRNCSRLTNIGVSKFNTSKVTHMNYMFQDCSNLTSLDVSKFKTNNVIGMSNMFKGCSSLEKLDVSNFDTSAAKTMERMFDECSSLTVLDVSNFNTSKVNNMGYMFYKCSSLTTLDVSHFDTGFVTDMSSMFQYCSSLTTLDVSNFDTSSVIKMTCMFQECNNLTNLDVSKFNTSSVTTMSGMFSNCSSLVKIDVSKFNTSSVTHMNSMFNNCSSITSLDVSHFDTGSAIFMDNMFNKCSNLTSLDVSNFNTSNVTSMNSMFSNCKSITKLDVSNFNTDKVTNMNSMFNVCSGLKYLDLSSFNISNATSMSYMFYYCKSLERITFNKDFISPDDIKNNSMFNYCGLLKTIEFKGDIPAQIKSNFFEKVGTEKSPATLVVPKEYMANYQAMFDGNKFFGGYFIMSNNVPNTCNVAEFLAAESSDQLYEVTGMLKTISGGPENSMPNYGFEISDYTGQMSGSLLWSANDTKGIGFKPGDIVTLIGKRAKNDNINYMDVKSASIKYKVYKTSIADFFTKEDAKDVYYMVSGTVEYLLSSILYCNLRINDGKGNSLYVHRCSPGYGASLDDSKEYTKKANFKVGDKVTFIGYKDTYKESVQLIDAFCFAHEPKIYTYKDIVAVADMIAEGGYTRVYDVNGDGKINVADIVAIANMILEEKK